MERLASLFSYYELSCPKHPAQYGRRLGEWRVAQLQHDACALLFEGLVCTGLKVRIKMTAL
jgi:hypothetical protein